MFASSLNGWSEDKSSESFRTLWKLNMRFTFIFSSSLIQNLLPHLLLSISRYKLKHEFRTWWSNWWLFLRKMPLTTMSFAICGFISLQMLSAVHIPTSCQRNNILVCGSPQEEHDERSFVVIFVYSWSSSSMSLMSKQSLTRLDLLPTCVHYRIRDYHLHGPNQAFGYNPAQLM